VFKIAKHVKTCIEKTENSCLEDIVQCIIDQDSNLTKDFEQDLKNAKDKYTERLELP